jgi:conjugal transfer pilus assembly protein TraA
MEKRSAMHASLALPVAVAALAASAAYAGADTTFAATLRTKNIQRTLAGQPKRRTPLMNAIALPSTRCGTRLGKLASIAAPVAVGALAATPALTKFTDFLEGSGGKIITVLSLAGGLIGLASGRFTLSQIAVPVGVGIGVGTGVPIVTSVVTAVI